MKFERPDSNALSWREFVRATDSIVSGDRPCEIHHPAGRTAKHDGMKIGHALILPLTADEHRLIDRGEAGLDELKSRYLARSANLFPDGIEEMSLHEFEIHLYQDLLSKLYFPFTDEMKEACLSWRRG